MISGHQKNGSRKQLTKSDEVYSLPSVFSISCFLILLDHSVDARIVSLLTGMDCRRIANGRFQAQV